MYKAAISLVMLCILGISVGCQPQALSDEEIRDIVRNEVATQLTGRLVQDVVKQEVIEQSSGIDDIVKQEIKGQLITFNNMIQEEVSRQLTDQLKVDILKSLLQKGL